MLITPHFYQCDDTLCAEKVEKPESEAEADFIGKYTTPVGLSVSKCTFS